MRCRRKTLQFRNGAEAEMSDDEANAFWKGLKADIARLIAEKDPAWAMRWLSRHEFCAENDLLYYGLYTLEGTALFLCQVSTTAGRKPDTSSIKRWTNPKNLILGFARHGADGKRIFGYQIADFYLNNVVEPR
jgi:hypothetical protein